MHAVAEGELRQVALRVLLGAHGSVAELPDADGPPLAAVFPGARLDGLHFCVPSVAINNA